MSCFILEIQLPHLFRVVINLSDFFFCTSFNLLFFFLQGQGCFIFPLLSASWSCALGSGESGRDEVEIVRRKERKEGSERERGREGASQREEREDRIFGCVLRQPGQITSSAGCKQTNLPM